MATKKSSPKKSAPKKDITGITSKTFHLKTTAVNSFEKYFDAIRNYARDNNLDLPTRTEVMEQMFSNLDVKKAKQFFT